MRDPVERLRSHARMVIPRDNYLNLDFKNKSLIQSNFFKNLEDIYVRYVYNNPPFVFRTRYENTINNLEKVFEKEDIFYCLYENLFAQDTLDRMRNFLNLKDLSLIQRR